MLIKHIRDSQRKPFGTIVADKIDGDIRVGISICCNKDQFSKRMGKNIAIGRLMTGTLVDVPNRTVDGKSLVETVTLEIHRMYDRAESYFKF